MRPERAVVGRIANDPASLASAAELRDAMLNDLPSNFEEFLCREARLAAGAVLAERGFLVTYIDGAAPVEACEYFAAHVPVWAGGAAGGLDLCVPRHVAGLLLPPELSLAATLDVLVDGVGELSNLLAGRLKLRGRRVGDEREMKSPTSGLIRASVLSFGGASSLWFACAGLAGAVHVRAWFDVSPVLPRASPDVRAGAAEGEIILF